MLSVLLRPAGAFPGPFDVSIDAQRRRGGDGGTGVERSAGSLGRGRGGGVLVGGVGIAGASARGRSENELLVMLIFNLAGICDSAEERWDLSAAGRVGGALAGRPQSELLVLSQVEAWTWVGCIVMAVRFLGPVGIGRV